MDQTWSSRLIGDTLDPIPHLHEILAVGIEFSRALIFSGGADDPAAGRFEVLDSSRSRERSSSSMMRREMPWWRTLGR